MSIPVVAPMAGIVISIDVKPGDKVNQNDVVATIEAMKMYVKIFAPVGGEVKEINVGQDDVVNPDTVVMVIE